MKRLLFSVVVIGLAVLCMPLDLFAQDTLTINPTPPGNLNNVINGDTLVGGLRAHPDRVYRLRHGVVYQITEPMNVNGPLMIVANDTTAGIRPPVLAPAILIDNSSVATYFSFIGKGAKVEMSDLYMVAMRADEAWLEWGSTAINIAADSVKLKLRRVVIDGFGTGISQSYWLKTDVRDCVFRNQMHTDSWFHGDPFMGGSPVALDTTLWYNNTFFANNSYTINYRGYTPLARFEHNTMCYSVVNPFLIRQSVNIHINNNIFYAQHAMGNPDHVINSWFLNYPDTASSSMIRIRGNDSTSYWAHLWWDVTNNKPAIFTGPEAYVDEAHGVTAAMLDATHRVYEARNNVWFQPQKLVDFRNMYNDTTVTYDSISVPVYEAAARNMWVKRTLVPPTYLSAYSKYTIDSVAGPLSPGGINIDKDPIAEDPGFVADVAAHVDSLIWYIHTISTGTITQARRWAFPNNTLYPPRWPLPENLAYSNSSLMTAGTDGFPVGDLNWFPDKKAEWELMMTSVKRVESPLPMAYSLEQNYPNPFNPTTTIEFALPKQAKVTLKVYNLLGQEVATLVNGTLGAGRYTSEFDAAKLASGTYIYRLSADDFIKTSKMLLIK
jgi:hypothetical protein